MLTGHYRVTRQKLETGWKDTNVSRSVESTHRQSDLRLKINN